MGAVSIANRFDRIENARRAVECDLTLSNSYATGGDSISLASLGLRNVTSLHVLAGTDHNGVAVTPRGFQVTLAGTSTAPLIKCFNGSTSETSSTTDNSALGALRVLFFGQ